MSDLRFTKMHGLGNDYVYVDCFEQRLTGIDVPALARAMSDRHHGIGSDGLILITPPSPGVDAHVRMEMYNADGSRGEMCGNGIRCVAKYAVERRLADSGLGDTRALRVQTDRGVLALKAMMKGGRVDRVGVDMGPPILRPAEIPVALPGERCVKIPLEVGGEAFQMTCVSMGNPHAVAFVPSVEAIELERIGPLVERYPLFPQRINFHVAEVHSRGAATMRTWERGSGLTMACGTGTCAVLVAGVLEARLDRQATIHLPGGDLTVEWADSSDGVSGTVLMTGPATEVFSGEWPV